MSNKILAVDDDPKILKILLHTLRKEGFSYYRGQRGGGPGKVGKYLPDLVILDIMMPGMDGFETFQRPKALHDAGHYSREE